MKYCKKIALGIATFVLAVSVCAQPAMADQQADLNQARAKMDEMSSQLNDMQEALATQGGALTETQTQIANLNNQIAENEQKLKEQQKTLAARVRSNYKTGATGLLDVILSSKSFDELISRVYYMNKVSEADERAIQDVRTTEETLKTERQDLENKKSRQEAALQQTEASAASYQQKFQEAKNYYNSLNVEVQQQLAQEAETKAQQENNSNSGTSATVVQVVQQAQNKDPEKQTTPAQDAEFNKPQPSKPSQPSRPATSGGPNTYPVGQCTWGAKVLAPWVGNNWGNANQWPASARRAGFATGSTPRVGAVAVKTSGAYGHVAVVTAVESPTRIRVSEANYAGNHSIGDYRGWFNPQGSFDVYIYPN